jgi:hypothetical protein
VVHRPVPPPPSQASKPIIQKLFAAGMAAGEANFAKGVIGAPWFYNKIVFKKVQALLGGKMKFAGTGSAPLAPKAQMFVQTAFNCPVRQGYGLTETCGASCTQNACDNSSGVVRPRPLPRPGPRAAHPPPLVPRRSPCPLPRSRRAGASAPADRTGARASAGRWARRRRRR